MEEELEKIILKVLDEYRYLSLDKNIYLDYAKSILNNFKSLDDLELELINYCNNQVQIKLKNNKQEVINNYIEFVSLEQNDVLNVLQKIIKFFRKYKIKINIDLLSNLVINNLNLNKLLEMYVDENIEDIKNNKLMNQYLDDNLIAMIEIYCDLNDIEMNKEIEYETTSNNKNSLSWYYQEIRKYPVLSREEEQEIFAKINAGDKEAYNYFIKCNLRLVVKYASKYSSYNIDFDDLIQEGNLGLMKAIDKFDPNKGYKFSTYANWWLRNYMKKYINNNVRAVRIPVSLIQKINNYKTVKAGLEQKLGYEVQISEIAEELGIDLKEVSKIELLMRSDTRLNDYANDDEKETELMDFIPSTDKSVEDAVINKIEMEDLIKLINELKINDRDKEIFCLRYGIKDGVLRKLEDIGMIYNLTRERVRQIEVSVLRKIRVLAPSRLQSKKNKKIEFSIDELVYRNLCKIGPRNDMEKILEQLDTRELELLKLVFGRINIKDGGIPFEKEIEFYKNVLPKIKEKYNKLRQDEETKRKVIILNEKKYDELLPVDIKKILDLLENQLPKELNSKLSYECKVILGFKLNNIGKMISDKSIADYFGISEVAVKKLNEYILNEYHEDIQKIKIKKRKRYNKRK